MARPLTAFVVCNEYMILDSPEPLRDGEDVRCQALIDHDEKVIWLDPTVQKHRKPQLILQAVCRAWQERLALAPVAE